jgi:hypothetical protein
LQVLELETFGSIHHSCYPESPNMHIEYISTHVSANPESTGTTAFVLKFVCLKKPESLPKSVVGEIGPAAKVLLNYQLYHAAKAYFQQTSNQSGVSQLQD